MPSAFLPSTLPRAPAAPALAPSAARRRRPRVTLARESPRIAPTSAPSPAPAAAPARSKDPAPPPSHPDDGQQLHTRLVTIQKPLGLVLGELGPRGPVIVAGIERGSNAALLNAPHEIIRVGDIVDQVAGRNVPSEGGFDEVARWIRACHDPQGVTLRLVRRTPPTKRTPGAPVLPTVATASTVAPAIADLDVSKLPSDADRSLRDAWSLEETRRPKFYDSERGLEELLAMWRDPSRQSDQLRSILVSHACKLARSYGMQNEPNRIQALLDRLPRYDTLLVGQEAKFCNNIMCAFIQCKQPVRAIEAFATLEPTGCANVECYTTLIKALSKRRDLEGALGVLKRLRDAGLQPNIQTYNALIAACVACRNLRRARSLFGEMLYDKVQPNVVSWNIILNWHASHGPEKLKNSVAAYEDMVASGVRPNHVTFTTLMKASCGDGNMTQAENVLTMMREHRLDPDVWSFTQLIRGFGEQMQWRKALSYFNELRKVATPDAASFAFVIDACARAGQVERAEAMLADMIAHGFEPRAQTYLSILQSCSRKGAVARAYSLIQEMRSRGCTPDGRALATFMNACLVAREEDLALSVHGKMKQFGIPTDTVTLTLLMRAYGQKGETDKAFGVLRSMRRRDASRKPSTVTYNEFILFAVQNGRPSLALSALRMMLRDRKAGNTKVGVDRNTFAALTSTCLIGERGYRHLHFLMDAMRTLREHDVRPNGQLYAALLFTCLQINEEDLGGLIVAEQGKFSVAPRDRARVRDLEFRLGRKLSVERP